MKKLTDIEAIDIVFLENIQREGLSPIEEGKLYLTRLKLNKDFMKNMGKIKNYSIFHHHKKLILRKNMKIFIFHKNQNLQKTNYK